MPRSFSSGHLALASRPLERRSDLCGFLARHPWRVTLALWGVTLASDPCAWAPGGGAGENILMTIEISRADAAHGHTGLPRFAVGSGSLGRIAPPRSRFFTASVSCHALQGRRTAGMDSFVQRVVWEVAAAEV